MSRPERGGSRSSRDTAPSRPSDRHIRRASCVRPIPPILPPLPFRHYRPASTCTGDRLAQQDRHDGRDCRCGRHQYLLHAADPAVDRCGHARRSRDGGSRRGGGVAWFLSRTRVVAAAGRPVRPPQTRARPNCAGLLLRTRRDICTGHLGVDRRIVRTGDRVLRAAATSAVRRRDVGAESARPGGGHCRERHHDRHSARANDCGHRR